MGLFDMFRKQDEVPKAERLVVDDDELETDTEVDEDPEEFAKEAPDDREEAGPFDESEADAADGAYIDFGALRIPAREGLALRMEFLEKTRRVIAVALDLNGSTLQVQAFAAPRSSGIWKDVRDKLKTTVTKQGGEVKEVETDLGTALHTSLPATANQQGKTGQRRGAFFYGVDGPRWFLRAVVSGVATRDDEKLAEMLELFRGVIVVRGGKAVPPRDLLELTVPKAMAEQMAKRAEQQGAKQQANNARG
ncbi:DUF3710 domain-containing protein [Gulosibacter faecalis]|jgi:hypothetical protein|uniref:DUF3710 domain-containing protein n=1 Tax=Gulosibacter faecalis TaxID=272240 RepID=A0ABW5UZ32_9MICO|nr:DUF3710 domain-containing protein [Gulosibacter faecalis]